MFREDYKSEDAWASAWEKSTSKVSAPKQVVGVLNVAWLKSDLIGPENRNPNSPFKIWSGNDYFFQNIILSPWVPYSIDELRVKFPGKDVLSLLRRCTEALEKHDWEYGRILTVEWDKRIYQAIGEVGHDNLPIPESVESWINIVDLWVVFFFDKKNKALRFTIKKNGIERMQMVKNIPEDVYGYILELLWQRHLVYLIDPALWEDNPRNNINRVFSDKLLPFIITKGGYITFNREELVL